MGSLVGGWNKFVTYKRNSSSLTKEEIDAYWRSHKKTGEDHLKHISQESFPASGSEGGLQKSNSMPTAIAKEDMEVDTDMEEHIKTNGWWTRSNSAFLNEPPVLNASEDSLHSYAPQYHVASLDSSKLDNGGGISV